MQVSSSQDGGRIQTGRPWHRPWLTYVALMLVLGASVMAHVALLGRRSEYRGPLLPLDHLFTIAAASALFLLCVGTGIRVLRACAIELDDPLQALPFAAALGCAAVGTILLAAGAAGFVDRSSLAAILGAIGLVCWRELHVAARWLPQLPGHLRARGVSKSWTILQLALVLLLLMLALRPPLDWDTLMYHLDVPAEYLAAGRVYLPPDNLHAVFIGPVQLLYLPLLAVAAPSATAVLNVLFAAMIPLALISSASRLLSSPAGILAAAAVWGNATLVLVAGTARIDTTLCLFTFAGHIALIHALEQWDRRWYLLSAALLGAAIGVKLQAVAYVLALLPLIVWVPVRHARSALLTPDRVRHVAAAIGVFALVGLALSLPWLLRNQSMAGTPFYPVVGVNRVPPWIESLSGSAVLPVSIDPYVTQWLGLVRAPFNLFDAFVAPGRLTIEPEGALYFLSPFLLLTPLYLVGARTMPAHWLAWGGIAYLLAVLLPFPQTNLRYLLPATVPLTLVAAHGVVPMLRRLPGAALVQGLLVVVALVPTALAAVVMGVGTGAAGHVIGMRSEKDYLARFPGSVSELRALAHQVPDGGRILFLFEARGYGIEREIVQDNTGMNWPVLVDAHADDQCLEGTGITHVLVNKAVIDYYISRGFDPTRTQWNEFAAFEQRCLVPIRLSSIYWLYQVRD